ncbi:Uncharacterized damage-inducible protein DinB (forms a four-helix bundle) [Spirosomataceae bacterium TFI 002]|nr:Uncharacterized damage-inducible protein DinB (forms a four-helix bundle) [Spirosomataceae bacterium TFI 002]
MITFIESYQRELADEAKETQRMLAIVPADKMDWQPHPKSMKIGALATHLAEMPLMIKKALLDSKWDFAEDEQRQSTYTNGEELVAYFNACVAEANEALSSSKDDILEEDWKLCAGDITYVEMQKWEAIRHAFGQNSHHRAQLGVYLRLLNVAIPGPYGPSADEM